MSLQSAFAYEVASHAYTIMDTPPCQYCACVCALRHVNGASGEGEGRVDESAQTVVGALSPTQSEPHREEAVGNGVSKNGQFSLMPDLHCYSEHVCTSYVHQPQSLAAASRKVWGLAPVLNTIQPIVPVQAQRTPISLWDFIWRFQY